MAMRRLITLGGRQLTSRTARVATGAASDVSVSQGRRFATMTAETMQSLDPLVKPTKSTMYAGWGLGALAGMAAVHYLYTVPQEEPDVSSQSTTNPQSTSPATDEAAAEESPLLIAPFEATDHDGEKLAQPDILGNFVVLMVEQWPLGDTSILQKLDQTLQGIEHKSSLDMKPHAAKSEYALLPLVVASGYPEPEGPQQLKQTLTDANPLILGVFGAETSKIADSAQHFAEAKAAEDSSQDTATLMFLINPEGRFVEAFGADKDADHISDVISDSIIGYKRNHPTWKSPQAIKPRTA